MPAASPNAPRFFSPGSAYNAERGLLYLFDHHSVLVVRAWPDPRAWRLGRSGPWKGARPIGLDLATPDRTVRATSANGQRRHANQAQAFTVIPPQQRRLAASFGQRAWPLHCLFSRVPGSQQLARVCPALAAGLAFHASLRPAVAQPFRSARALLAKPPARIARAVADWLGFPPGRATVRVLRRLPAALCGPGNLQLLRRALAQPSLRRALCHLPRFNVAVLSLLHHLLHPTGPVRSAGPMLQRLAALPSRGATEARSSIAALVHTWAEAWPQRPLPRLITLAQLSRLRQQANVELHSPERIRRWALPLGPFATPPIQPDNVLGLELRPLGTVDQLLAEAAHMGHCIGSRHYVSDSVGGAGFGYAVLGSPTGPASRRERATAWVVPDGGGRVALEQIHGPSNHPPSEALVAAVNIWIHQHNYPHLAPRRRGDPLDRQRKLGRTLRVVRVRRPAAGPPPMPRPRLPPPCASQQQLLPFIAPF